MLISGHFEVNKDSSDRLTPREGSKITNSSKDSD